MDTRLHPVDRRHSRSESRREPAAAIRVIGKLGRCYQSCPSSLSEGPKASEAISVSSQTFGAEYDALCSELAG
jgi:hypothetical protein